MAHFTAYMLLIVFVTILGISQSNGNCFYQPGQAGKKCFDAHYTTYTCCPLNYECQHGTCTGLNAIPPLKSLPLYTSVVIGVGAGVFCLACIFIGVIYWHHRQMKKAANRPNPFSSFSQSINSSTRGDSSVGFHIRPSPTQSSAVEESIDIKPHTSIIC